jgi:hypothetical protein
MRRQGKNRLNYDWLLAPDFFRAHINLLLSRPIWAGAI